MLDADDVDDVGGVDGVGGGVVDVVDVVDDDVVVFVVVFSQKLSIKRFVKIWSVTAEILLIFTNVALTNFTMTVGNCSQKPTFKV